MRANYRWYLLILVPIVALITAVYLLATGVTTSNENIFTASVAIVGASIVMALGRGIFARFVVPRRLIKRIETIKRLEGAEAVPELIVLLSDPLAEVRTVASERLSTLEADVTPALAEVLAHSSNELARVAAADTFGEKLDRAGLPRLQDALEHEQSAAVRTAITQAIQNIEKYGKR